MSEPVIIEINQLAELYYGKGKTDLYELVEKTEEHNADFPIPRTKIWGRMVFKNNIEKYFSVEYEEKLSSWGKHAGLKFNPVYRVEKVVKTITYTSYKRI